MPGPLLADGRTPLPRAGRAPAAMVAAGALLGLVVLAATVLWVLPGWLDWSRYRTAIAAYAAGELGRPVRIDGPISVALLPAPLVTAGQVRLGDRGDGIALTAPTLRLRLAFAPLLLGRVVPRDLVLSGAVIRLPWPLPPAALAQDRPDWLGVSAAHVEHGTLSIGALTLTDLDADLGSADARAGLATGGLVVGGSARLLNRRWRLTARLGLPDGQGGAPVEATLGTDPAEPQDHQAGGRLVGTLARDGAFAGRVTASAADLSMLMPAPRVAARLDGEVTLGRGPAGAELALNVGGVPIAARLQPAPPGVPGPPVLSLRTGRLDLEAWERALRSRPARPGGGEPSPGGMLRLPWPVSLDLAADTVAWQGGLIRNLHAAIDVQGDHAALRAASAILPGEAAVTAAGAMTVAAPAAAPAEPSGGLTLTGTATLDAPQLHTTLDWLRAAGLRIGAVPSGVLRTARLGMHVLGSRDRVDVSDVRGSVDDSTITGRLGVDTATGAIDADLTLDRLAADRWLPDPATPGPPAPSPAPGPAPGPVPSPLSLDWPAVSRRLSGFALHLKLHAGQVPLRGLSVRGLDLDAATNAGGLAIDHAAFDLDGVHAVLAGTIAGDGQVTDARIDLGAASATGLAGHLPGWAVPGAYLWAGPLRLHAEATGPLDALIGSVSVDLADARLEAHPVLDLADGSWTAQMTLRHPGAPRLLGLLGWPQARDWLGEGSLSLLAQLSSAAGVWQVDSFDLTAATLHASGDLKLDSAATPPVLSGHVVADTLPLAAFAVRSHDPMPWPMLAGNWRGDVGLTAAAVVVGDRDLLHGLRARLGLAGGVLTIGQLTATLAGGTLTGQAVFDGAAAPPRLAVDAALASATAGGPILGTPIDVAAGRIDGIMSLTGRGYSPAALLASLSGQLRVRATAGLLDGIGLAAPMDAAASTEFDRLDIEAHAAGGVVTLNRVDLASPAGAATAAGTIDVVDRTLGVLAHLPGQVDLRLSGPIAAPRRSQEK